MCPPPETNKEADGERERERERETCMHNMYICHIHADIHTHTHKPHICIMNSHIYICVLSVAVCRICKMHNVYVHICMNTCMCVCVDTLSLSLSLTQYWALNPQKLTQSDPRRRFSGLWCRPVKRNLIQDSVCVLVHRRAGSKSRLTSASVRSRLAQRRTTKHKHVPQRHGT